ncbi:MAG: minichromosome maintenance protein MCM, partial [Candidatus Methanomethyliaceae archaeon]
MEPILTKEMDYRERFANFLRYFQDNQGRFKYREALAQMASLGKTSLVIDFEDLMIYDSELAKELKEKPNKIITYANFAIADVLRVEHMEYVAKIKEFKARFRKLDEIVPLRELKASFIGKLIMIEGIITRTSAVKQLLKIAVFQCPVCGREISIEQSSTNIITPNQCDDCGRKGKLKLLQEKSEFIDWQKIRVQERPEELPPGQLPRSIDCVLQGDLVDTIRPGDRVYVIGILQPRQESSRLATFSVEVDVNYIEISEKGMEEVKITPEDEKTIIELSKDPLLYQKIFSSIAPSIYGYEEIKEAIAYQLAGGVPKIMPDGIKVRGDINILLVGDPGTAKSQLLQYVAKIAPRGIYTSGKGATAAGLTATVVRDKETNEFFLEAGALVLADNGIACIDEIDKMRSEDRVALHEAMEQ